MQYFDSILYFGKVVTPEIKLSVSILEKCLRKKLRLKRGAETNLLNSDFEYFLPNSTLSWKQAWLFKDHVQEISFKRNYSNDCQSDLLQTFEGSKAIFPDLTAHWSDVQLSLCYYGFYKELQPSLELGIINHFPGRSQDDIAKTKFYTHAIAEALEIDDFVLPVENGYHFKHSDLPKGMRINQPPPANESYRTTPGSFGVMNDNWSLGEYQKRFNMISDFLECNDGKPEFLSLEVLSRPNLATEIVAGCGEIASHWDIRFFSEYRKRFDPFTRPSVLEFEEMYPVVNFISEPKSNSFFLDLQVTVYHGLEESSLLLHTQREQSFLQEIADEAGLEISEFGVKDYHGLADLKI